MKTLLAAVIGATLALSAMESEAQERAERKVQLAIEQQSLADALNEWAKQTGLQLVSPSSEMLNTIVAPRVKGAFTPRGALEQLLKDTPLTYEWVSERAVAIRERSQVMPAALRKTSAEGQQQPFQMAQFSADTADTSAAHTSSSSAAQNLSVETLDEVVVTGTHIRGGNAPSTTLTFSAEDIAETGYATVQDWLETLPQNFGSGSNEENGGPGNFNRGTAVNLRGLGAGATLVLVNGRRQPASGLEGDFVDVSSIPTSAIRRVEVLTDGASALYGSDAIGGVVNFILRDDFKGAETSARYGSSRGGGDETLVSQLFGMAWASGHVMADYQYYERSQLGYADRDFSNSADKRDFGGSDFRTIESNPGNILVNGLPAFAIPTGQDGTQLEPGDLLPGVINLQEPGLDAALLPRRKMHTAFISASQRVTDALELFVDARYSLREVSFSIPAFTTPLFVTDANPFFVSPNGDPFVEVAYSFYEDFGADVGEGETETYLGTLGTSLNWGSDWHTELSVSAGREDLDFALESRDFGALFAAIDDPNPETAFNPFGDGSHTNPATLAAIASYQIEKGNSHLKAANMLTDGSMTSLPGGDLKVAFGLDYRSEDLERGFLRPVSFDRSTKAVFAELLLPLVGPRNSREGVRRFEISTAARYEDYDDFGTTLNPKVSLRYDPLESLHFRGSWGTSFKAPRLIDLDEQSFPANVATALTLPDPASASGFSDSLVQIGGNSGLSEETAKTWTVGIDLELTDRLIAAVTYYDIEYKDRIAQPGPPFILDVLLQEDQWTSIINRNPTPEQIATICNDSKFLGSVDACLISPPTVIVDFRRRNMAKTDVRGIDLGIEHSLPTDIGTFGLKLNGTYVISYETAATDDIAPIDVIDTINNPVSRRLRLTGTWDHHGFGASVTLNHTGSYRDNVTSPARSVDAWDTLDMRFTYRTGETVTWMRGLEVALSAANVLDEEPPFVNNIVGYDPANATPLGRFVALQLTKNW